MTTIGPMAIPHDPAKGCWFDVPPIVSAALTPVVLTIDDPGTGVWYVVATRRRGNPAAAVWSVAARHAVSCPPPGRKGRRKKDSPLEGCPEAAGTYRVFAHIAKTDPETQGRVWLTYGEDRPNRHVTIETGPSTDGWWYDLGTVQVNGQGGALPSGRRSRALPVTPVPMRLHERTEGPGGIEWGQVVFLPADTEFANIKTKPGPAARLVLDGNDRSTYRVNQAGALLPGRPSSYRGDLPFLSMRHPTRVFVLAGVHGGTAAPLDGATTVTLDYQSRLVHAVPLKTGAPEPDLSAVS